MSYPPDIKGRCSPPNSFLTVSDSRSKTRLGLPSREDNRPVCQLPVLNQPCGFFLISFLITDEETSRKVLGAIQGRAVAA